MYYKGEGVEKNYKKAIDWWEKSAWQDKEEYRESCTNAQHNLGCIYYKGEGVQDYKKALYF